MNRFPDFVRLDSFYMGIQGGFQTHFVLEKATPGIPTWNYAIVHLHEKPSVIEDPAGVENILDILTAHFESINQIRGN